MALPTSANTYVWEELGYGWPSTTVDDDDHYADETLMDCNGQNIFSDGAASGTASYSDGAASGATSWS